jgi:hypothetical protein
MSSCFIKRPKLIRLMPVFPSGAGLKNRASGETQGPEPVRRARLVCGKTKRRDGVAARRGPALRDGRALAATRREAALDRTASGSDRSKTEGKSGMSGEPAHLLKLDDIQEQRREAQREKHAAENMRADERRVHALPSRQKQNPVSIEAAIFDTAAPSACFGA